MVLSDGVRGEGEGGVYCSTGYATRLKEPIIVDSVQSSSWRRAISTRRRHCVGGGGKHDIRQKETPVSQTYPPFVPASLRWFFINTTTVLLLQYLFPAHLSYMKNIYRRRGQFPFRIAYSLVDFRCSQQSNERGTSIRALQCSCYCTAIAWISLMASPTRVTCSITYSSLLSCCSCLCTSPTTASSQYIVA